MGLKSISYLLVLVLFPALLFASEKIEESIVKIYTVSKKPSYSTPWNSTLSRSYGSGSIIDGERILTNAHVVADETFIEVKRHGDTKRYEAKVEYISHQTDLALLSIEDKDFFKGTKSLDFGVLPKIQQEVAVYGFPMGGNSISVSTGIVSRIEHTRYAHSREIFLSIQIDAAVNPGSSGGPAISDGKIVGVVMQQITKSQNIGYIVPIQIVQHFLKDVEDKKYDGYPHLGIGTQKMENRALRDVYHMKNEKVGVRVIDISKKSSAFNKLQDGDILLRIDGHDIEYDGTVEFVQNQFTSFKYYIDEKHVGESVTLEILRNGKKQNLNVLLSNVADDDLLVDTIAHDVMPKYFIYGGYVFSPLTRNLLMSSRSTLLRLREAAGEWATDDKEEVVVLLKVLASKISRGDHNFSLWMIDKVNGKKFKNFNEFVQVLRNFNGEYLILENESGVKIAINKKEAMAIEKDILSKYSIKSTQRI